MSPHYPEDRFYHLDALWLQTLGDDEALVGVNHHAQTSLGTIMYVDLPRIGSTLRQGAAFGTIESSKAVSDLIAPASGKVLAINAVLRADPSMVNRAPYAEGWLLRIRLDAPGDSVGLISAEEYLKKIGGIMV